MASWRQRPVLPLLLRAHLSRMTATTSTRRAAVPGGGSVVADRAGPGECPVGAPWRQRLRQRTGLNACFRGFVFLAGLLVLLLAGAVWMFSALLTLPPALAALWIWSREFHWGQRLLHRVSRYGRRMRTKVSARPARWAAITAAGFAGGAACSWAISHYSLIEKATNAVGL